MSSPDAERAALLRQLPSMDRLLAAPTARELMEEFPRAGVKEAFDRILAAAREAILRGEAAPSEEALIAEGAAALREAARPRLVRAVNATGIILHTGLGRAVLPEAAMEAIS